MSALFLALFLDVAAGSAAPGFDHSLFDRILHENVTPEGWVDYRNIRDRRLADLDRYLGLLARADVKKLASENERKAFWINAYNAVCIRTLIAHDLPASVPKALFFGANIFKERTYRIAGKVRSLDDIEHGILRKRFKDNRVHAAVVCGASSCPRLRPEAYTGAAIDRQLDEECRRWIQKGRTKEGKRKNYLDRSRKIFYASKIFDWFQEDFGDSDAGVLAFVKRFASDEDRAFLEKNRVRVRYLPYSWKLNIIPPGSRKRSG